jgi:hypothetical protein
MKEVMLFGDSRRLIQNNLMSYNGYEFQGRLPVTVLDGGAILFKLMVESKRESNYIIGYFL